MSENSILVKLQGVTAPTPVMHYAAAEKFRQLRNTVAVRSGGDFLARCGDILRPANFTSTKDGVANRSWHKTGRAFDYDQESKALVIVSEAIGGKQFFRTYLKCAAQDGSLGKKIAVKDMRGYTVNAFLFDFTAAAEAIGFKRIPAWSGWQKNYNRREFWHYQFDEGLTWDAAMLQLKANNHPESPGLTPPLKGGESRKILGLNDRGDDVRAVQAELAKKGFLPKKEVDGIFGAKTRAAVAKFQSKNGLSADGLVGPMTRAKLFN